MRSIRSGHAANWRTGHAADMRGLLTAAYAQRIEEDRRSSACALSRALRAGARCRDRRSAKRIPTCTVAGNRLRTGCGPLIRNRARAMNHENGRSNCPS